MTSALQVEHLTWGSSKDIGGRDKEGGGEILPPPWLCSWRPPPPPGDDGLYLKANDWFFCLFVCLFASLITSLTSRTTGALIAGAVSRRRIGLSIFSFGLDDASLALSLGVAMESPAYLFRWVAFMCSDIASLVGKTKAQVEQGVDWSTTETDMAKLPWRALGGAITSGEGDLF